LASRLGSWRKGGPPLRAGPPFLDLPGKPVVGQPRRVRVGPGAGRRQAGPGSGKDGLVGVGGVERCVNRRVDAGAAEAGRAGERWWVRREADGLGRRWSSRGVLLFGS
jgi:hypothetical protein